MKNSVRHEYEIELTSDELFAAILELLKKQEHPYMYSLQRVKNKFLKVVDNQTITVHWSES